MSEIKVLDKLRCHYNVAGYADLQRCCDEIEAEIADNYIRLPCDADGIPWTLETESFVDDTGREVVFSGLQVDRKERWKILSNCVWHDPSLCHHVKPDQLEKMLNEYVDEMLCIERNAKTACERYGEETECTKVFAERIRNELLGGDAE